MRIDFNTDRTRQRTVAGISLAAGGGDFATGLLLVLAPEKALTLMGVPMVKEPVLLQFVGVFVACVGASYLLGLLTWAWTGSRTRLRVVWELTMLFRVAVGIFVALQIHKGNLPWAWVSIPITDWLWALVQAVLLQMGFLDETR